MDATAIQIGDDACRTIGTGQPACNGAVVRAKKRKRDGRV
jgi:hypothetical protein